MIEPASPLPWDMEHVGCDRCEGSWQLLGPEAHEEGFRERDAAYIVHAANCFPRLLSALKAVRDAVNADSGPLSARLSSAVDAADDAIASADPGTGDSE